MRQRIISTPSDATCTSHTLVGGVTAGTSSSPQPHRDSKYSSVLKLTRYGTVGLTVASRLAEVDS